MLLYAIINPVQSVCLIYPMSMISGFAKLFLNSYFHKTFLCNSLELLNTDNLWLVDHLHCVSHLVLTHHCTGRLQKAKNQGKLRMNESANLCTLLPRFLCLLKHQKVSLVIGHKHLHLSHMWTSFVFIPDHSSESQKIISPHVHLVWHRRIQLQPLQSS